MNEEIKFMIKEVKKEQVEKQGQEAKVKWKIKAEDAYQEVKITITTEENPELAPGDMIVLHVVRQQQKLISTGGADGQED